MGLNASLVEKVAFNLIKQAVIFLPADVKSALQKAYRSETSEIAKTQLKAILDNVALAEKHQVPVCQDTGTIVFYVKAGSETEGLSWVEQSLVNATRRATAEVPLRPNAVHPFTQKNSGDNTGKLVPQVHWEITEGAGLELAVMPKGGGSENVTALGMLTPAEGLEGLGKFVVNAIVKAGAQPCPPTVVGVAVGGGADTALGLAKKNLLKPLNEVNSEKELASLERKLFEAANKTGIGPMGLGGINTVLKVHVDYAYRHPASFPVAVAFNCWASRRAAAKIASDATVQYLTNPNWKDTL